MFKRILVATDGSDLGERAVRIAGEMAANSGASLDLLHVQTTGPIPESLKHLAEVEHLADTGGGARPGVVGMSGAANIAMTEAEAGSPAAWKIANAIGREILKRAEREARAKGVQQTASHLEEGDPAAEILKGAVKRQADLIVLGNRGLGQLERIILGSVSREVAQKAACTCMIVK